MILAAEPTAEASRSHLNKLRRCTFVYVTQSRSLSQENISQVGRGKEERRAGKIYITQLKKEKRKNIYLIYKVLHFSYISRG